MGEASPAKRTGLSVRLEGEIRERESCALRKECQGVCTEAMCTFAAKSIALQVIYNNEERFGEVYYFYRISLEGDLWQPVALISLYSTPDPDILETTSDILLVCRYQGDASLVLVEATAIKSLIAMVPFLEKAEGGRPRRHKGRFYLGEMPGLTLAELGMEVGDEPPEG